MEDRVQVCARCIMDTSVPGIRFDEMGRCNFCRTADASIARGVPSASEREGALRNAVAAIKAAGKGRAYDCILGISGGTDSCYAALLCHKAGLRVLAVTMDNGWDSREAGHNVEQVTSKLGIPLERVVLDWEEFKDLQLAFFRSGISNVEIPTDHAIPGVLLRVAAEHGVRTIIVGGNTATEGISVRDWEYNSKDWRFIKGIQRQFGSVPLRTYPGTSLIDHFVFKCMRKIRFVRLLNYVDYNAAEARRILKAELGWEEYGRKHYESVFTRFFQGSFLPQRFGIDKRRAHFSSLIASGQMTREIALAEMTTPPYPDPKQEDADRQTVLAKLGLSREDYEQLLALPKKTFLDYPSNYWIFRLKYRLDRMGIRLSTE